MDKKIVGDIFIDKFESALECTLHGSVKKIDFFWPCIELEDVVVRPSNDEQWQWHAKKLITRFTWRSLLGAGIVDLHIWLHELKMFSALCGGQLAILPYLQRAIAGISPALPTFLKEAHFTASSLHVHDTDNNAQARIQFSCDTKKIDNTLRSSICLEDGSVGTYNTIYMSDINGILHVNAQNNQNSTIITCEGSGSIQLPHLPDTDRHCFFSIDWKRDHGTASLKNANRSFVVSPIHLNTVDDRIVGALKAQLPLYYCTRVAGLPVSEKSIYGTCIAKLLINMSDVSKGIHGNVTITGAQYGKHLLCEHAKCSFSRNNDHWKGGLQFYYGDVYRIAGSWYYDQNSDYGSAHLENSSSLHNSIVRYWSILPQDASVDVIFNKKELSGKYRCIATNTTIDTTAQLEGIFGFKNNNFALDGSCNKKVYQGSFQLKPSFCLHKFLYGEKNQSPAIIFNHHTARPQAISGSIDFSFFRELIRDVTGYDVAGDGKIAISTLVKDDGSCLAAKISLANSTIRLPHTYNLIKGFDAIFSVDIPKKIIIRDVGLDLHRGFIACERALLLFNDQLDISFVHVPLVLESCLLNLKRDLFALISGSLLLTKPIGQLPKVKGAVILERAQLKESLFSDALFKQLIHSHPHVQTQEKINFLYDVNVQTKDSIQVQTPFLQTQAHAHLSITGSAFNPCVEGAVILSSGTLHFPYKPLYITKGSITFIPGQLQDPLVDLVAQNKVRKYHVALRVSGSRSSPIISLCATPPLTEEQSIALLFTGAPEESLNIVMPALLMQNIKGMLFENQQSTLAQNSYFASLLKPLERIYILPRFSDQTGRGGIRGAIEIELSERWRALIQQNFSLSEDTRFELEYLASDNMSVRAFRDERRDAGGEVEMRWKW